MMRSYFILVLVLFQGMLLSAQYNTPNIDGTINFGEYGTHVDGQNQQLNGATTWYMTWDANNLYLAYTGSNISEAGVLYLDFNPVIPVNGGTDADGSNQGFFTYDRNHMRQPFRADFALYFKDTYHEYRYADAAGYWGAQTSFSLNLASNGGSNSIEVAIPWNTLTNGGGRPDQFNWYAYKVYNYGSFTNGVYQPVPVANPSCACNTDPSTLYATHYYNVLSTASGASTPPFSVQSLTHHEDNSGAGGGLYLNGGSFYDLTINDNSGDNSDNDPGNHVYNNTGPANRVLVDGNIEIAHDLYIAAGSALMPADNNPTDVLATVTFTGRDGSLYNYGRIDATPEASGANDWDRRRLDFVFDGVTTIEASDLFKDRFRFANVTVNAGDTLLGPLADSANIELAWGTWDNNGVVDFGGDGRGFVDLGTRGDWSQQNDYFINSSAGSGTWILHDILIGRNSSHLQPVNGGNTARLQLRGDFENYDEFSGINNGGQIDVVMAGSRRQYMRGNVTETNNATTIFHNLEIDNDDGQGNFNNAADVVFESFGGGNIEYYLTGSLTLTNGDLVTRDRNTSAVHNFTLADSATVNASNGRSNTAGNFSCMVDGPLRYEVENASAVTRGFPLGKTRTVSGTAIGDFRPIGLTVDLDAATKTTFTAEMFLEDRSTFYTWPSPIPETIIWISRQRYWNVSMETGGANLQSASIALTYDTLQRHDGVNAPGSLRIVKDDGAGNWVNITPLGPGGTAVGNGAISSQPFFAFSDFTLASVLLGQPLPVVLGDFNARRMADFTALRWNTQREVNVSHFVVEKSVDQADWEWVGEVQAIGNSATSQLYTLDDPEWERGIERYFYRLQMVDRDGAISFSPVREVTLDELQFGLEIYPNPAQHHVWIDLPAEGRLRLIDLSGKVLMEKENAYGLEYLEPQLAEGMYLIEFIDRQGKRVVEKLSWKK